MLVLLTKRVAQYMLDDIVSSNTVTELGTKQLRTDVEAVMRMFSTFADARHWPFVKDSFNNLVEQTESLVTSARGTSVAVISAALRERAAGAN